MYLTPMRRGKPTAMAMAMAMSLCFSYSYAPQAQLKGTLRSVSHRSLSTSTDFGGLHFKHQLRWSFVGGSQLVCLPRVARTVCCHRKGSTLSACLFPVGLTSSQIANSAFTWGTVTVLPFYTLMVLAPNSELTKRSMESSVPYVLLSVLYAYLLYLSWTPDTLRSMFASKYWLPELPGIARMFSNEVTVASAWIHLLVVDLFAARQVFHDGLKKKIETRHSVSLCLLFCPVGILAHVITKLLTKTENPSH